MHVNRTMIGVMAAGFLAIASGRHGTAVGPTSALKGAAPSSSKSPVDVRGDTPDASPNKELNSQASPRQAGIGAALRIEDGKVLVTMVLPDTPAARSILIKANDQIVAVAEGNEEPVDVTGIKDVARVVGMIRGSIGTIVRLTTIQEGKGEADRLVVSLVRGDIKEIDSFVDGRLLPLGAKAPNFKFIRLGDAEEADLSQHAGRIVVVEFWASWCGPCVKTVSELESVQEQHPEWIGQAVLLAVSVDERKEDAVALFNRNRWSKVSTVWAGSDVLKLYRVAGLPTIFVIDRDGNVAAVDHRLDVPAVIKPLLHRSVETTGNR